MGAPGMNILGGIKNTSMWLQDDKPGAEEALKFFVHFMGDLHMPLHLTGRSKGGNGGLCGTKLILSSDSDASHTQTKSAGMADCRVCSTKLPPLF